MDKTDLLRMAGEALYGERWQTDMTSALGLRDPRRIRQWLSREKPIPDGIWKDLYELLEARKLNIDLLLNELEFLEKKDD